MADRIKYGIIGLGSIAQRMAGALACSESGVLYACASRSLEKAEAFKEKYGAVKAYGDYLSLIEDPQVEAVYIATIHPTHAEVAKMCIEHHKPILCEKPMFITEEDTREIIELAEKEKVLLMEAMWTRTLPAFRKAKEWVEAGRIGKVRIMLANFIFYLPRNEKTKDMRHFDPTIAGGANWDAGVYTYDYFTGIMGQYPVYFDGTLQIGETGIDESCAYTLQFADGTLGVGTASFCARGDQTAMIYGTEGYIRQDDFIRSRKVELFNNDGELLEVLEDSQPDGFVHEVEHFSSLVRSGALESPLITHENSLDYTIHALKCVNHV